MSKLKIMKYRKCQIHYVNDKFKYDVYDNENRWCGSMNTLKEAKNYIKLLIFTRENIPL
jgi:hypothetical protein